MHTNPIRVHRLGEGGTYVRNLGKGITIFQVKFFSYYLSSGNGKIDFRVKRTKVANTHMVVQM